MTIIMADVIVLGDYMLDIVLRSSRATKSTIEWPAFSLVSTYEALPGGAGTVSRLLISAGLTVACIGIVGDDWAGRSLKRLLTARNMKQPHLFQQPRTNTRVRVYLCDARGRPFLRVDQEGLPMKDTEKTLSHKITGLRPRGRILAISDFGKGCANAREWLSWSSRNVELVVASTKTRNIHRYRDVDILIVNGKEQFSSRDECLKERDIRSFVGLVRSQGFAGDLIITNGKCGLSCSTKNHQLLHLKSKSTGFSNTVGCGDAFFAALLVGISKKESLMKSLLRATYFSALAAAHPTIALPVLPRSLPRGYRRSITIRTIEE